MGTKGEIEADMGWDYVNLYDFQTMETEKISIADAVTDETIHGGHGGGDLGIVRAVCQYFTGCYTGNAIADIRTSVENHLVTFAAEDSRLSGSVITMEDYIAKL